MAGQAVNFSLSAGTRLNSNKETTVIAPWMGNSGRFRDQTE